MGTIAAIGGGELRLGETEAIDREIVALTNKKNPLALFLPTASGEPQGYVDAFREVYGERLGCRTETLLLLSGDSGPETIREKILSADLIYVGGGDTKRMMQVWREKQVDVFLKEAYEKGVILAGLSAGSICWFSQGFSDSDRETSGDYCLVEGLGLIGAVHCPHYNERPEFDAFMRTQARPGIAIGDRCALIFEDGRVRAAAGGTGEAYLMRGTAEGLEKFPLSGTWPIPLGPLLEGCGIRYITPEDIPGMARVYVDTWKAAYRGIIAQEYLDGLTYAGWEERYRTRHSQTEGYHVAVMIYNKEIIGVTSFMKTRDGDLPEGYGEIVSLYVLPEYWSRGYGRLMLDWAAGELRKLGFSQCALWALKENHRAQRAYERFGFQRDGAEKSWDFSGVPAAEVRYRMDLWDQRRNEEC